MRIANLHAPRRPKDRHWTTIGALFAEPDGAEAFIEVIRNYEGRFLGRPLDLEIAPYIDGDIVHDDYWQGLIGSTDNENGATYWGVLKPSRGLIRSLLLKRATLARIVEEI